MCITQENQQDESYSRKKLYHFILTEFCIFAAQTLTLFIVAYIISDSLSNEDRLMGFINGKINTTTMKELGLTLFSATFVLGLFSLIQEISSSHHLKKISREVLFELPRTIYLFGSSITASTIAIAFFLSSHPQSTAEPVAGYIGLSAFFAITFFVYGSALKALFFFSKKRECACVCKLQPPQTVGRY